MPVVSPPRRPAAFALLPEHGHGLLDGVRRLLQRCPLVSAGYIVAMIPLGLHLYHGFWSMFQTMGWNNVRYNVYRRPLAALIALAIFVVNISFPLAVLTGIIHE